MFALPTGLVLGSGVFLIAYAAMLVAMARSIALPQQLVRLVILGNLAWAMACVALAALSTAIVPLGIAYLGLQAVAVVVFAALQSAGVKRSPRAASLTTQRA